MSDAFDPASHSFGETRYFEDFELGEEFYIPSRTLTDANFTAFQAACCDNHPIHYDRHYCQRHGHRDLLAHGFQVLIQTTAGTSTLPHLMGDSLVAFLEQSSEFLAPVYAGDTVYPKLTIAELKPQRRTGVMTVSATVHNQDGELVLNGWHKYLLRKRATDTG